ncbi:hypothetical protein AV274_5409 [Blastocystis sp. ATCC 50177/Nand II]|uniref:Uncharacterized protein n=1 Tax=Blastocystis sp. subtype 1 (strain ATCC 50177 / NandII) TaxID=478820 RepID=A0A196S941_BLAHN|nr:hypothetical protein AV274_5409 [Blastocystis sp. ATCC 50177/Nand II]
MQKTDEEYRFLVLQRIRHIFKIAEQAVKFDRRGDYAKAVSLYSVCSTLISAEVNTWYSCCSEKVKKKLVKLRAVYNYRVDSIRDEQIGSYSANCTLSTPSFNPNSFFSVRKADINAAVLNGNRWRDDAMYKVMRIKELLRKHILSKAAMAPDEMFFIQNVTIPMYREKMNAFHTLGSISFSSPSPSLLVRSLETVFNALYKLKMQAKDTLHFDIPSEPLRSYQEKRFTERLSYLSSSENMTESEEVVDLMQYRNELQLALETLSYLSAFEAIASENRKKTEEEMEEDNRSLLLIGDCRVLTKTVFIPLVVSDLHHLSSVYVDYRKRMMLTV